ncbi:MULTISPECIES: FkbM family methyltransferase [Corynebacterium]|uniref:FkbM family methyltransferase n=1 Tax=Corynebacterium TaxID=1716 RepID=UPI000781ABF8|nr:MULTISPECIES: FkbM family methyltransferase [Corynebacterium]OFR39372.1 hypothetical protein HMPREF2888_08540 [Corynebacterium sp. HMSC077D03]
MKSVNGNLLVTGFKDEYIFEQIRKTGRFYELDLLQRTAENSSHLDGIVVDAGANLGNHSLYFSSVPGRDVVSFEPETANFALLKRNIAENNLESKVEVHNCALWDSEGFVNLNQAVEGNNGTFKASESDSGIPRTTIDNVVRGRQVAVIKIDVEGAEAKVLGGAAETIKHSHPLIVVESHTTEIKSEISAFLEPLGYTCVAIAGASDNYFWLHRDINLDFTDQAATRVNAEGHRRAERFFKEFRGQQKKTIDSIQSVGRNVEGISKKLTELEKTLATAQEITQRANAAGETSGTAQAQLIDAPANLHESIAELKSLVAQPQQADLSAIEGVRERLETLGKSLRDSHAFESVKSQQKYDELLAIQEKLMASVSRLQQDIVKLEQTSIPAVVSKIAPTVEQHVSSSMNEHRLRLDGVSAETTTALDTFRNSIARELNVSSGSLDLLSERVVGLSSRVDEVVRYFQARDFDDFARKIEEGTAEKLQKLENMLAELQKSVETQSQNSVVESVEKLLEDHAAEISSLIEKQPPASFAESIEEEFSQHKWLNDDDAELGTKFAKLLIAYEAMAKRLEALAPHRWNAKMLLDGLHKQLDIVEADLPAPEVTVQEPAQVVVEGGFREAAAPGFLDRPKYDPIRIGIASMAGREEGLRQVVEILSPQADEIFVYLNDMDSVPDILPKRPNVRYFLGPDTGDRGKFKFMEGFEGYYLTCDDDIAYAPFHVQSIIDGIERYERKAVVGWHGSIFKPDFQEFYNAKYRQVLSFRFLRGKDTPVHLLGTGVCGFHTSTLNVDYDEFIYPNMADAFLAIAAKRQSVPMVVLAHGKDWATPIDVGPSISSVSLKRDKDTTKTLDVATTVTNLVKAEMPWEILEPTPVYERKPMQLVFIGRTDKERWKKGGILKSAHLTRDMLERFNVTTILEDIETGDPKDLHGADPEIVMIYVGDPERPDFKDVEVLIAHHAKKGRHVVVNLSYNAIPSRSEFIVQKMKELRSRLGNRIWLMVFTEAMLSSADLAEIRDWLVVIPKTISLPDEPVASFGRSEGIFIGDIAKLSNDGLLGFPGKEWVAAIRRALPNVPIYAVQQYKPKDKIDFGIDEIWPFMRGDEFARNVGKVRVMISTVKYATFEMVPLEVASLGVPVIYPEMPQSLGEYLGLSGFSVRSPEQLERILPVLYHDPIVWRSQSQAGIERAWSSELNRLAGQTYLRLIDLVGRKN